MSGLEENIPRFIVFVLNVQLDVVLKRGIASIVTMGQVTERLIHDNEVVIFEEDFRRHEPKLGKASIMRYTLGFSPCPNDTFMFHALLHGLLEQHPIEFDTHIEDVETLNEWALQGKLDITKLSFHTFLKVRDQYELLHAGAALGFGVGPLLIAREHLTEVDINRGPIAVPGQLTTAHMLFQLRYPNARNKQFMIFSDVESAVLDGRAVAGVIIHENRFTYADKGLVKIKDLGEFWEEETGTPIPLGAIVAKKSLGTDVINSLNALLAQSVQYAFDHPDASKSYVSAYAAEMDPEVMRKHIQTYVNDYSIDLGPTGRSAVLKLEEMAKAAGIVG